MKIRRAVRHISWDLGALFKLSKKFKAAQQHLRIRLYSRITEKLPSSTLTREYNALYREHGTHSAVFRSLGESSRYWQEKLDTIDVAGFIRPDRKTISMFGEMEKTGIPNSIFTNASEKRVKRILSALEINFPFTFVLSGDDLAKRKPDLEGFHKIVELSRVNPQNILYIGDRIKADILPAKEAGMLTALAWAEEKSNVADFTLGHISQIISVLGEIHRVLPTGEGASLPYSVAGYWANCRESSRRSLRRSSDARLKRFASQYLEGLKQKLSDYIKGYFETKEIKSMLEIAGGDGALTKKILYEVSPIKEATLVDINKQAVDEAGHNLSPSAMGGRANNIKIVPGNIYNKKVIDRIKPVDLVVIFNSLMNLSNLERIFEIANMKLNEGGLFIGNITNIESEVDIQDRPIDEVERKRRKERRNLLAMYQRGEIPETKTLQYVFGGNNLLRENAISENQLRRLIAKTGFEIKLLEVGFHLFFIAKKIRDIKT